MNKTNQTYVHLLQQIKAEVNSAHSHIAMAVNSRLVFTYWQVGRFLLAEVQKQGWGAKVLDQLSKDLKEEFPHMKGFSRRNLVYMQTMAKEWPVSEFAQQPVAQLQKSNNQSNEFMQHPVGNLHNILYLSPN